MAYPMLPYVLVILVAPVVGIGVSELERVMNDDTQDSGMCEMQSKAVRVEEHSSIVQPKKAPKYYPSAWRASRRIGMHKLVTTLYNVHLNESLPLLDGQIPPDDVLTHFFRCRGFATEHPLDSRLVEAVIAAAKHFQADRVEVISAYRSPKFNDALGKKGRNVATESKHTRGMAMDVRLVGTPAGKVGNWMYNNFDGGVGTYSMNDFVHIDTGPKRRWRGR